MTAPQRIVSLVPSQTELLAYLGLQEQVVGITKFCVHPSDWLTKKTIVGGTKNFDFDAIDKLNPDLIIGNKEENYEEGINILRKKYQVWISDIVTVEDSLEMIKEIGSITHTLTAAHQLVKEIETNFKSLTSFNKEKVLYLIWRKPWMAAGQQTFINSMLITIGLQNVVTTARYPILDADELLRLNPEYLLLSSEPYPFKEKHIQEIQELLPTATVLLVDGELFSWHGSRQRLAPAYFQRLHAKFKANAF